jgi:hypothetical protein
MWPDLDLVPGLPAGTGGELKGGMQEVGTITACISNYYLSQNVVVIVQFTSVLHQYASGQCVLIQVPYTAVRSVCVPSLPDSPIIPIPACLPRKCQD